MLVFNGKNRESLCSQFAARWTIDGLPLSSLQWSEVDVQLTDPTAEEEDVATSSPWTNVPLDCHARFLHKWAVLRRRKLFTCWNNWEREREGGRDFLQCVEWLPRCEIQAQKQDDRNKSSQVTWSTSSIQQWPAGKTGWMHVRCQIFIFYFSHMLLIDRCFHVYFCIFTG